MTDFLEAHHHLCSVKDEENRATLIKRAIGRFCFGTGNAHPLVWCCQLLYLTILFTTPIQLFWRLELLGNPLALT
jgi:hypothetical protein